MVLYFWSTGLQSSGNLFGSQPHAHLSGLLRCCPVWDGWEALASNERGVYVLQQSALLSPPLLSLMAQERE